MNTPSLGVLKNVVEFTRSSRSKCRGDLNEIGGEIAISVVIIRVSSKVKPRLKSFGSLKRTY